jgi:hypothetical protein
MSEISYLERREENDPFHSVKGVVDYFSNSVTSPFASTQGPEKKLVETAKNENRRISMMEVDARDDTTKRVVFHPSIVSSYSGEDLAFDPTRVYTYTYIPAKSDSQGNDGEQRDGILSKKISAPKQNSNLPANQVYTGMSRRCRADLLKDDDSEANGDSRVNRIMKTHRKKQLTKTNSAPTRPFSTRSKNQSFLKELKEKVNDDKDDDKDIQQRSKFTSRWQNESQAAAAKVLELETEGFVSGSAPMKTQNRLSPKKYSVSKISKARSGPVPKSEDFFSELKQWHKDYGLRQVDKPREITVTTTKRDMVSSVENDGKESKGNPKQPNEQKKKKFWQRKTQKPEHPTVDVRKRDDEEAKKTDKKKTEMKKEIIKASADVNKAETKQKKESSKKKKNFWNISTKSKRKQKDTDTTSSKSAEGESDGSQKSVPLELQKSVPMNPTLGITQNPTKVLMKGPEETFVDTLSKFLELQSEMREEADLTESDVSAEKCFPSDSKEEATKETTRSFVLVETVHSTEGESSTDETPEPKVEPNAETTPDESLKEESAADEETLTPKSGGEEMFSELMQTDSWLEKASGFFRKDDKANEESTDAEVTEQDQSTEPIKAAIEGDEQEEGEKEEETLVMEEKPKQTEATEGLKEKDAWFGNITGFFKKDETIDPPVMVVEVDKYAMDKYEAVAEAEEAEKDKVTGKETVDTYKIKPMLDIETADSEQEEILPIGTSTYETSTSTYDELMDEEQDFPVPDCPCMKGKQQPDAKSNNKEEVEIQTETATESQHKELTWLEMASGFFTTNTQTEVPIEEESSQIPTSLEGVQPGTPRASNRGFFSTGDDNGSASANETEKDSRSPDRAEPMADQSDTFEGTLKTGMFDDSLLSSQEDTLDDSTKEEVAQSGTFDDTVITKEDNIKSNSFNDCLLTSDEGTKLTKFEPTGPRMVSLLDLPANQSESQPCVDSTTPKQGNTATESPPCSDSSSKNDPPSSITDSKSLCVSEPPAAELVSCHDSKSNNDDSTASNKKPDMIVLRKKGKESAEKVKNSDAKKYTENKMTQDKGKKSTAAKNQKKKAENGKKKEMVVGATLFGRLEPVKKPKKHKKKAPTLF